MVVAGFRTPWISILYLVSQIAIAVHLSHGVKSALQSLGLVGRRFTPVAEGLAVAVAAAVFLGNVAIVLGVWAGLAPPVYPVR
jgi:succinate dehydrogenase / fumarate reductase cytochrome b subunit